MHTPLSSTTEIRAHGLAAFAVVSALILGLTPPARGQVAYRAANSGTSIIPRQYGFFNIDFSEVRVGLTVVGEWEKFGYAIHGAVSARSGQSDLFDDLTFNPGYEVGGRLALVLAERGDRYDVLYLGGGYRGLRRRVVTFNADSSIGRLSEPYQSDVFGSLGYNHSFGDGVIAGISVSAQRELSSPGVLRANEVCTPGRTLGGTIGVLVCSDRFTGPLADLWSGQARSDVMLKLAELGTSIARPMLALLAAGSVDVHEDASESVNFGIGAAIAGSGYPGQTFVQVMLELYDAFDANDQVPGFGDRFVIRVGAGLPFEVLTR